MNSKRRGFTIVELLIYMGIMSILLIVLTDTFASILDARTESESVSSVVQDGDFILARFMYDIPQATSITTPASPGSQGSTLQIVINGINYTYALNGGNLELTNNNGTNRLNSVNSAISNLLFTRIGDGTGKDTIQVSFTVTSTIVRDSGAETKNFTTTIGLR